MKELLIDAVRGRKVLSLRYHGYSRTVEPHCVGTGPHGDMKLRCWQTEGGSVSGEMPGWKILNVREIHSASTTGTVFPNARPGYKQGDKAMRHIDAQI